MYPWRQTRHLHFISHFRERGKSFINQTPANVLRRTATPPVSYSSLVQSWEAHLQVSCWQIILTLRNLEVPQAHSSQAENTRCRLAMRSRKSLRHHSTHEFARIVGKDSACIPVGRPIYIKVYLGTSSCRFIGRLPTIHSS